MKPTVISYKNHEAVVEYSPNFIERLIGMKPIIKTYREDGTTFMFGGGRVWYDKETGEGQRCAIIDNFIRKQQFATT